MLQDRPHELTVATPEKTCVHVEFADRPQYVAIWFFPESFMSLDRDAPQVVEMNSPHVCSMLFVLQRNTDVVYEQQKVSEEYAVGRKVLWSSCCALRRYRLMIVL